MKRDHWMLLCVFLSLAIAACAGGSDKGTATTDLACAGDGGCGDLFHKGS